MSGRGKGGKALGSAKRAKISEYEWGLGEEAFAVAHCVISEGENQLFIVPAKEVDPVLAHVVARSETKNFMWNLGEEDSFDDFFELITKPEYDAINAKRAGEQREDEKDEEGEEDEEDYDKDYEIENKDEVIEEILEWLQGLGRFAKPASKPVQIVAVVGFTEE